MIDVLVHDELVPNAERIGWWLDDLRSGKFTQCREMLARDVNGASIAPDDADAASHCCLGVAGVTARRHGYKGDLGEGIMSKELADWYGLPNGNPIIGNWTDLRRTASDANDEDQWPFTDIADALQETFLSTEVKETNE